MTYISDATGSVALLTAFQLFPSAFVSHSLMIRKLSSLLHLRVTLQL